MGTGLLVLAISPQHQLTGICIGRISGSFVQFKDITQYSSTVYIGIAI